MGKKKRCSKGKSCGSTCIENRKACLVDTSDSLSNSLNQVSKKVDAEMAGSGLAKVASKPPSGKPGGVAPPSPNPRPVPGKPILNKGNLDSSGEQGSTQVGKNLAPGKEVAKQLEDKARKNVDDTLSEISSSSSKVRSIDGLVPADRVNWSAGKEVGANYVASGVFGSFVIVPSDNLVKGPGEKIPKNVGIKYGKVTAQEIELLKEIGEIGAGPRVIAAKVGGKRGAIAMEALSGKTMEQMLDDGDIGKAKANDAYFRALSKLHKAGIAHGDAHFGNVIVQPDGIAKLIDLGHAQKDAGKAFAEALRRSYGREGEVVKLMEQNLAKMMKSLGRPDITDSFELLINLNSLLPKGKKEREEMVVNLINQLYSGI